MEWHPPIDSVEESAALEHIDTLIARAGQSRGGQAKSQPIAVVSPATPPVERILAAVEQLLMIGAALERAGHPTRSLRTSLERVLQHVTGLCDDWGFATARVRVDFIREDLKSDYADLNGDITELVRHLRYDARSWNPAHRPAISPLRRSA
jgi:hypothetical protein